MRTKLLDSQKSIICRAKSNSEEPYPDQTALLGAVTVNDHFRYIRKSSRSSSERGIHILLPSCQNMTPVLRAAITGKVRDSIQQERYLPFPWGYAQAGQQKLEHSPWQ